LKLALVGGNPKGFDRPFHPSTLSGKRLQKILSCLVFHGHIKLIDMTENSNDVPTSQEVSKLKKELEGYEVVFLGRFVEKQLRKHFPNGVYLPHPASRRKSDLQKLQDGLASFEVITAWKGWKNER
jgi:hypothetical protein